MQSPYTLFTCHIPSFILLIALSRFHITHHITSRITHHNTSHPTSQFTHHHINTMTCSLVFHFISHAYIIVHTYHIISHQHIIPHLIFHIFSISACVLYSFHWLTMVAILQLKASKLIVYSVSFTVVIFTILNIFPTREYYLMDNANNTTTSNNTSYKSHLRQKNSRHFSISVPS